MGFRRPVTSVAALDTGAGAPGVRIYASGSNPASGVVEWNAGAAKATGTLVSGDTGSGGQIFTLGLAGGPSLGLNVAEDPAGGYLAVVELTGDQVKVEGALVYARSLPRTFTPATYAAGWSRYSTAGGNPAFQDAALFRLPDGTVRLQGLFQYVGGAGAGNLIYALPPEWRPKTRDGRDVVLSIVVGDAFRTASVTAAGAITLRGALPAAAAFAAFDLSWPGPDCVY